MANLDGFKLTDEDIDTLFTAVPPDKLASFAADLEAQGRKLTGIMSQRLDTSNAERTPEGCPMHGYAYANMKGGDISQALGAIELPLPCKGCASLSTCGGLLVLTGHALIEREARAIPPEVGRSRILLPQKRLAFLEALLLQVALAYGGSRALLEVDAVEPGILAGFPKMTKPVASAPLIRHLQVPDGMETANLKAVMLYKFLHFITSTLHATLHYAFLLGVQAGMDAKPGPADGGE